MPARPLFAVALLAVAVGCGSSASPTDGPADTPSIPPAVLPPADGVTNRQYAAWARYKPGTSVTLSGEATVEGNTGYQTMTGRLVEVSDTVCVVETTLSTVTGGQEVQSPPGRLEFEKDRPDLLPIALDPVTGKPVGTTAEGTQARTIGGTEFACRWYRFRQPPSDLEGELWVCDEFPGYVVRLVRKTHGSVATLEASDATFKK
jgi:hypothetical protein